MIVTDFPILDKGPVSKAFLEREIRTFAEAANYVQQLKYGRNKDKTNLLTVLQIIAARAAPNMLYLNYWLMSRAS